MFHYGASGDTNFSPHLSPLPPASPAEGGEQSMTNWNKWECRKGDGGGRWSESLGGRERKEVGPFLHASHSFSLSLSLYFFVSSFFVRQNNEIHLIVIAHDLHRVMTAVGLTGAFYSWMAICVCWNLCRPSFSDASFASVWRSKNDVLLLYWFELPYSYSGRDWRSLWKVMLLMQEKFDSLSPADQRRSVGYRGKQSVFASAGLCNTFWNYE